jgi:hypothetical protein
MKWILDKLEEDIDQNIYNLKKHGLGSMAFIKKLKEVKKDVKALQELTNDGGDDTNSDKHNLFNIMEFGDKYFGGDEQVDLGPKRFYTDEEGDEYYLSSNGRRYYLFSKVVTLKGDREQTIYTFGKKNWLKPNDLTLLRFFNIPYDKCVVENKSGYPFLKGK